MSHTAPARWPKTLLLVGCLIAGTLAQASTGAAEADNRRDRAWDILDAASDKAWAEPDPRWYLPDILGLYVRIDSRRGCEVVREQSDRLARSNLPPSRYDVQGLLAALVAPHDRQLRDLLLRRAVADARAALSEEPLWKAGPDGLMGPYRGEPDEEKRLLAFSERLWGCVLRREADPDAAAKSLARLLNDAGAAGYYGTCEQTSYDMAVRYKLAGLDPTFLLSDGSGGVAQPEYAWRLSQLAHNRWLNGQRDSFTGLLITYAVNHGMTRRTDFETYMQYDLPGAWALARTLPQDRRGISSDRDASLCDIITFWAWQDPDAALAASEGEPDADLRRDLVERVAKVWAYKRPEQIERALRNQDNAVRRDGARETAAEEIAWRKGGGKPHDSINNRPRARYMTPEERRAAGIPRGNPEELRVLENPGDTVWLEGPHRLMFLRQAAAVSYWETGKLDVINKMIAGLTDPDEIDDVLCHNAEYAAQWGTADDAAALVGRVRSPRRALLTSCRVARTLLSDPE